MAKENGLGAGDILLAFLMGAVTGAAVALLFAPATGEEIRKYLSEKARESQEKAAELTRQGREALNRQKETISGAVDRGREAYRQTRSEKENL